VVGVLTGPADAFDGGLQHLVGRHPQHLLHVDGGGRHEDVDPEGSGGLRGSVGWAVSSGWARARLAITGPRTSEAMRDTASKSPGEEAAKPASSTSTRSFAS